MEQTQTDTNLIEAKPKKAKLPLYILANSVGIHKSLERDMAN